MDEVILEVKHISKYFGQLVASNDINLTVKKGTVHSIIGENGAGKSTLMNMISGIYKPSKGEIIVKGAQGGIQEPQ